MLLSIEMIVKNEEKYLEQCLTALKPILDNVESELIIADTGSTDRTVEIAQKFTDNVFYFEWIKDFAAARNSTLEKARGEWYMFIDADEIFRSCDNIIKFFNSGEYKKYNSASYTIRNLLKDDNNEHFADFSGPRITKILPHTRFVGEIHEALSTYGAPFKKLNDICDHYGYLYAEDGEFDEKFKRNSELLMSRYDSGDRSDMLYAQLYECFVGTDSEKANRFWEEGVEFCKKNNSIVLTVLYSDKMSNSYRMTNYEEALDIAEQYFGMDKTIRSKNLTTDAEIYGIKASSLYNLNRYEEAIDSYEKFFDLYKQISSGKLNTYDMFLQTYVIATERNFIPILNEFTRCCILAKRFNTAASYLQNLPISKYVVKSEHISALASQEMEVLAHFEYEGANKFYKQLDENGKKVFKALLRDKLYQADDKQKVLSALVEVGNNDSEIVDKIRIYDNYFKGFDVSENDIYSFAAKYSVNDNADLFYITMDNGYDISPLLQNEKIDLKLCVYICYMSIYGFHKIAENYAADNIINTNDIPKAVKFLEYCMKTVPIFRCPKPGVILVLSVDKLFETYAKLGKRYAEESGIPISEMSPEMRAALIASEIVAMRNKKRYKECFSAMNKAIGCYEGIAAVIKEYQKIVMAEFEESVNADPSKEMERLALKVKRNIRRMILLGNLEPASKMLSEFKSIMPYDPDIEDLQRKINLMGR